MRTLRENILRKASETINLFFPETNVKLHQKNINQYCISGDNLSKAINIRRNERNEVNVAKWFENFWLYFEIFIFFKKNEFRPPYITLSVFQGRQDDNQKTQLFRAEWENYANNNIHPQPHWHIYPFKYESKYHEDFEEFMEFQTEDIGFENIIKQTNKTNLININDFHFAINGNWIKKDENHIHKLKNAEDLFKWLYGILGHIKSQLEYVKQ